MLSAGLLLSTLQENSDYLDASAGNKKVGPDYDVMRTKSCVALLQKGFRGKEEEEEEERQPRKSFVVEEFKR